MKCSDDLAPFLSKDRVRECLGILVLFMAFLLAKVALLCLLKAANLTALGFRPILSCNPTCLILTLSKLFAAQPRFGLHAPRSQHGQRYMTGFEAMPCVCVRKEPVIVEGVCFLFGRIANAPPTK